MIARRAFVGWLLLAPLGHAQTLGNGSLSGKYYFRHLMISSSASGNFTEVRSLLGALIFDGIGGYTFSGQQNIGTAAPAAISGAGTYAVTSAGLVTMTNPSRSSLQVSARLGSGAVIGSTTETSENVFDLLVAVPSPTTTQTVASLAGSYWAAGLEITGASASQQRSSHFLLRANGAGALLDLSLDGHAANQRGAAPFAETVTGGSYSINGDGTGTIAFPNSTLLAGNKVLYVSRDGATALGGSTSAGAHDILFAVKTIPGALSNLSWKDKFWGAGLRIEGRTLSNFAGSVNADGGGKLVWSQRVRQVANLAIDFTGVAPYTVSSGNSVTPGGTGRSLASWTAIGAAGDAFVGTTVAPEAVSTYELFLGSRMPALSGPGAFLNPQGVFNAASYAGGSIAPGQFVSLFGSGLASQSAQASTAIYPSSLAGVQVLINDLAAPVYSVSPGLIAALVPFAVTGAKATLVVNNNGTRSNPVEMPLAKTAPGIFTLSQTGTGLGAVLHTDYSIVDYAKPAKRNETLLVFLTGLGAVSPAVADGAPPPAGTLANTLQTPTVRIGGKTAQVSFSGLAPCCAGLYQMNITIPANAPFGGAIPLSIETAEHFHDQVDLPIVP